MLVFRGRCLRRRRRRRRRRRNGRRFGHCLSRSRRRLGRRRLSEKRRRGIRKEEFTIKQSFSFYVCV
jgi:hypothetical protein